MCDMNCQNCYYKAINPVADEEHCYMFAVEPSGECRQFRMSREAQQSMKRELDKQN